MLPENTVTCLIMSSRKGQVKYKKAPQAPRRFKSSYMFFSTEKHRSIRKELAEKGEIDKLSTTDVAKLVSQAWRDLSNEEREVWEDMARNDKARYEMEKSMYTGPWKVPAKKRSQKDPSAPKRPMSAFLSFSNSKRGYVKEKYPSVGNAEISRILAQMWKDASPEERKDHVDKEFSLRQQYKSDIAEWRKNSEMEIQTARKEREDQAMKAVLEGKPLGGVHDQAMYTQHEHQAQEVDQDSRGRQQDDVAVPEVQYGHHGDLHYQHLAVAGVASSTQASAYYLPSQNHQHSYYQQQEHAHHQYPSYYNGYNAGYVDYYPGVYPSGMVESSTTASASGYATSAYHHDHAAASSMYPQHAYEQEHQYYHQGHGSPPHASQHPSHHAGLRDTEHHHDESTYQDSRNSDNHHHGTY